MKIATLKNFLLYGHMHWNFVALTGDVGKHLSWAVHIFTNWRTDGQKLAFDKQGEWVAPSLCLCARGLTAASSYSFSCCCSLTDRQKLTFDRKKKQIPPPPMCSWIHPPWTAFQLLLFFLHFVVTNTYACACKWAFDLIWHEMDSGMATIVGKLC